MGEGMLDQYAGPQGATGPRFGVCKAPVMESIRLSGRFARLVTMTILALFLNAVIWPSWAVAIESERQKEKLAEERWQANNQHLHQVLKHIKEQVNDKKSVIDRRMAEENDLLNQAISFVGMSQIALEDTQELARLAKRSDKLHQSALKEFAATEAHLRRKGLPEQILQRHQKAEEQFRQTRSALRKELNALLNAGNLKEQHKAIRKLKKVMKGRTQQKPRDPFDPDNLPWGTPDPSKTPEPAETANELSARTGLPRFEQGRQLATNEITPDMLGQPGGPTQADLDPTPDIELTQAIQDKAAELDHDPVKIYQWVRNNIEFIPSYGSIQGADYTLEHGKGNAFDTASLLIGLLRASNIPARYAFGTVTIPVDKVKNWVGNVQNPQAAANLLGQAGIPNILLRNGGKVTHVRMEHVWAQAWVDFVPSRGAQHKVGDHWIPMDASFKQYDYTEGMDLKDEVPFDAQGLADTIQQQSTINEDEGWVQDVPQQEIETAITDYRDQLKSYLDNQAPDATVGEVLGTQSIKTVIHKELSAGLPYRQVTRELTTAGLPDRLRWKFRYTLNKSQGSTVDTNLVDVERSTVELAGKQLGLSFKPATQEDEDTLKSYLPEPDENGEIDPADLPGTLPGYLIHLKGEFRLGKEVVATADTETAMGAELHSEMGYWQPGQGWQTSENSPIAGEYRAIGLNLQGISQEQIAQTRTDLESTKAKLDSGDFSGLTKQQGVGDVLYSTILSYLSLNDIQDEIAGRQRSSIGYRSPSYGLFKANLNPVYWYGVPREVKASGLGMDVDRMKNIRVDMNNNDEQWADFNRAQGARLSAMEHAVPQEIFSTSISSARSISSVKAIKIAQIEGQKIYTIDKDNLSSSLSSINFREEVEQEIQSAVNSGKRVTTHESEVKFSGKKYAGYIITDPKTGSGAFKIGGGENGSNTSTPGGDGVVSWLLGILDEASNTPWLKAIGGIIDKVITALNVFLDIGRCGVAFGVAKFFAGLLATIAIAHLLMPLMVLLMMTLAGAVGAAFFIGSVISSFFTAQWSCKE